MSEEGSDIVKPSVGSGDPPDPSYQYPFASSPDIIRSHQKDAYFQGVLLEQLTTILRRIYGARFVHKYTSEAHTFADLLYLGLTTFVGNRTLGEEYCDIIQVEDDTAFLPSISRRTCYILSSILLPYTLNKILPAFRRRLRAKLEATLAAKQRQHRKSSTSTSTSKQPPRSIVTALQHYLLTNLDTLTSPTSLYALSLATFYFTGAYYHLSKRLLGLRYIFTRVLGPSDQRVGYEVLGVLLVAQLSVQSYLHLRSSTAALPADASSSAGDVSLDPTAYASNTALLPNGASANTASSSARIGTLTHTPVLAAPRYDLADERTMQWLAGPQARKCTLCLEPMKEPAVTTCGHVFCWSCITDWAREKPECPLCRQGCLVQHILPLRGA